MTREVHVHKMIRATAIEMAGSLYDDVMAQNPELYAQWKASCPDLTPRLLEAMWIELMWPKLIDKAKATLAHMLTTNINEELKWQISDALIADNQLRRGRGPTSDQIH